MTKLSTFKRRQSRVRSSIRKKSRGRMRLSVFRSNQHIYAQIINDLTGQTLVSASSLGNEIKKSDSEGKKLLAAHVGQKIAEKAKDAGINNVVFDRGKYLYHGRIRALAEAARENGLLF